MVRYRISVMVPFFLCVPPPLSEMLLMMMMLKKRRLEVAEVRYRYR